MQNFKVLIVIIFTSLSSIFARTEKNQISECEPISINTLRNESYFQHLMIVLSAEDNYDSLDAIMHKGLSSNSFVSFEQTMDSVIKEKGKIEEKNLILALKFREGMTNQIFVITQHLGYCHAFKYDKDEKILDRVKNVGPVVLTSRDILTFESFNDSTILFVSEIVDDHQNKIFRKYFKYDFVTLSHYKNCITTNNEENCKEVNIDFSFLKKLQLILKDR